MTTREDLLTRLNALRAKAGMPDHPGTFTSKGDGTTVELAKNDLVNMIHELENPVQASNDVADTTASLLKRLNVSRERNSMPALKTWKASRADLLATIARLERTTKVEPTKCPTKIAKGSGLTKIGTDMHTNKLHEAVKKQRATEAAEADAPAATKVKKATGKTTSPVRKGSDDYVGPSDIADALKIDPRKVRIFLRKHEGDIPSGYRNTTAGRWAFMPGHKQWVLDWVKKGGAK